MKIDGNKSMKTRKTLTRDILAKWEEAWLSNIEYSTETERNTGDLPLVIEVSKQAIRHLSTFITVRRQIMRLTGGDLRRHKLPAMKIKDKNSVMGRGA